MMKRVRVCAAAVTCGWVVAGMLVGALDAARVGEPAPAFTATDSRGQSHALADYAGKFVVLEWHNFGCSYVKKHYAGHMQQMQKEWTGKGVVWLTVISSGPGQQGFLKPEEANGFLKDRGASPTALLLDTDGVVGTLFDVKTTPQVYVIAPDGTVIYTGAVDSKPTTDAGDIPAATNYLAAALTEALGGKPVTTPTTRPYGCSVKLAPATPRK